jgi:hypothetical protein
MKRKLLLEILQKHLDVPKEAKREFWAKETSIFYRLIKIYPDEEFWRKVNFDIKLKSFAYLLSCMRDDLKKKYADFLYVPQKNEEIAIGEKVGEDYKKEIKIRTVRQFLSN